MIQTQKGSRRKSTLKSGLVLVTSLRAQRWRWRRQKTQLHEGWTDHREAPLKGRRCLWIRKPENLPRLSTIATNKKKIKLMLRAWFENDKKKTTLGKHRHATKVLAGNIQTWTLNTLISEYIFSIHWCWQEYLLWRIKSSFSCVANAKTPGCPSLTSRFYYFFLFTVFDHVPIFFSSLTCDTP